MKGTSAAFAGLLMLVVLLQPAAGQAAAPVPTAMKVLEEPAGDVLVAGPVPPTANPTPALAQIDLVSASVLEKPGEFVFTLQVAKLDPSAEPPLAESGFYAVHFQQGDVQYAVEVGRIKSLETGLFALLSRYDPAEDHYYAVDFVPVEADVAAGTLVSTVGRDLIVDSRGAKPYPGKTLEGFWAESQAFMEIFLFPVGFTGQPTPTVRDRMPDAGTGTAVVPVLLGPVQAGSARLASLLPTRQSNGEAATFVFTVTCRNVGEAAEQYKATATNVPSGWEVAIPVDVFSVEPGGELAFPVLVTTPFNHKHGTFQSIVLRVTEADDPAAAAELELGVRYPKVPQPAGHHPLLWLHGARFTDDPTVDAYALAFGFNVEYAWMNAFEKDVGDQGVPVPSDPTREETPTVPGQFRWSVPLAPDLAIGLDFNMEATTKFVGAFQSTSPLLGASLSGELAHYVDSRFDDFGFRVGGNRTVLATLAPSAAKDLAPNDPVLYELDVKAAPGGDLVPYRPKSSMVLELTLTGNRPDTFVARDPPKLLPGAVLALPLFEYHDPVDSVFAATPKLTLQTFTGQDRLVNPGKTLAYQLGAHLAPDAAGHTLRVEVTGQGAQDARVLGPTSQEVGPGGWWNFTVAVKAPAGAKPNDVVDLVVRTEATDDPTLQALVRLYGTVTTDQEVPDEAGLAASLETGGSAKTPGIEPLALLAALAAAALALRRRKA